MHQQKRKRARFMYLSVQKKSKSNSCILTEFFRHGIMHRCNRQDVRVQAAGRPQRRPAGPGKLPLVRHARPRVRPRKRPGYVQRPRRTEIQVGLLCVCTPSPTSRIRAAASPHRDPGRVVVCLFVRPRKHPGYVQRPRRTDIQVGLLCVCLYALTNIRDTCSGHAAQRSR